MEYSVVIPVRNEAENIQSFVTEFIELLPQNIAEVLSEVLLIENGSTDFTLDACYQLQKRFPQLIRVFSNDRGSYGEAIKRGIIESRGTHLSVLECDCLNAGFVAASIEMFQTNKTRFIVGSKRHPDSIDERVRKRRILTILFNFILYVFIRYPGTDTHGLKSIETQLAKLLCDIATTTDEVFQTELVLLAWRLGTKIEELPVCITEVRPTPISVSKRLPMVLDTVRLLRKSLRRFPHSSSQ